MPSFDPESLTAPQLYKLLAGSVLPRPIALVSSISSDGIPNLAPFSFFTIASADPPVLVVQNSVRGNRTRKDTIGNVESTGEFVVNIVSEDYAAAMNLTAGEYGPEVDEFAVSGLTPVASECVAPARVGEARVQMECRLLQIVRVSDKPMGGSLMLGQVVRFHFRDDVIDAALNVNLDILQPVGRLSGSSYVRVTDRFDMQRP
ncbi:MAG: flavin reductase family protein [Acidobacteria bacterium]|nr:flavin reductase family protein [Acidobacteriota bacterium]